MIHNDGCCGGGGGGGGGGGPFEDLVVRVMPCCEDPAWNHPSILPEQQQR